MDQSGNNQLLLRASQSGPPGYNGYNGQHATADRMRELLARTVQDHIVEERTTDELRTQPEVLHRYLGV